jgi:AbrB family looped-hinge helix DNA binding protein
MKATVSEKGQVTVPKALRERMGIRPGDQLEFDEEDGRLVAVKATPRDPVESVYGIIALPGGTDGFIREMRGPGPDDHGD